MGCGCVAEACDIVERAGLALATVMARRGVAVEGIGDALGLAVPKGPGTARAGLLTLVGTGPGTWLAVQEGDEGDFAEHLSARLAGLASVSDQSSGYAIFRLSGPAARTLLQRGLAIDLHPEAFAPGSAATSQIAHMGVILWQVDATPTYDIALFRSYAHSFRHWLDTGLAAL